MSRGLSLFALWLLSFVATVLPSAPLLAAEPDYQVEFWIGDRVDPTRKWGHVSLRVAGPDHDVFYDFGRYGAMWNKDAEGDPILRIWENKKQSYIRYSRENGGTTVQIVFRSTRERNRQIRDYFKKLIEAGRHHSSSRDHENHVIGSRHFHAIEWNCVTVAIAGFMVGFPEHNLHVQSYARGRGLGMFYKGAAQGYNFDQGANRWHHIWWPDDLRSLLMEQYVNRGQAAAQTY